MDKLNTPREAAQALLSAGARGVEESRFDADALRPLYRLRAISLHMVRNGHRVAAFVLIKRRDVLVEYAAQGITRDGVTLVGEDLVIVWDHQVIVTRPSDAPTLARMIAAIGSLASAA